MTHKQRQVLKEINKHLRSTKVKIVDIEINRTEPKMVDFGTGLLEPVKSIIQETIVIKTEYLYKPAK